MTDRIIRRIAPVPKPTMFREAEKAELNVAAYARVSTDHEDQETSLNAQVDYYSRKIKSHPGWKMVQVYVDNGISGLSMNRREGFNRMIADCEDGRIDMILTKSISRFARNTVDTVATIRRLKEKGINVYFEKENIFTLDSKGEFLLTLMSSLAQEESRSISENVTWGQRKRMADGKVSVAYSRFLGYDQGPEKYTMVVNEEQAVTVRRIYLLFLQGYAPVTIANILTQEGRTTPTGGNAWNHSTVQRILSNEKYKGDALLQKEFTADFLTKKIKKNKGEVPQYYVEEDHEAIISPWLFDYVQERMADRIKTETGRYSGTSMLSSKIVCGKCGAKFGPRPWHSNDKYRKIVWQCRNRWRKPNPCKTHNIHDKAFHYAVHDAARCMAEKRKLAAVLTEILDEIVPDDRAALIKDWIRSFKKKDIMRMPSDEEDLSLIIRRITVQPDKTLLFRFIDGSTLKRKIPEYSSKTNEVYFNE